MSTGNRAKTLLAFAAGLGLGLAVLAGYAIGVRNSTPELKLHAMSGYGSDTFGMVTGPVDSEAEGVFTLDYNTGELRCFVINPRTGRFGAGFARNVVEDLKVEKGKDPKFVMATGLVQFRGFTGPSRPANCVVYVADANSGRFGAYVVPWTPGAFAAAVDQLGEMKLLATGEGRAVQARE
jgi:hypothetical protein